MTRCVCGYNTDNEGLMIQCDTCHVWQHAECVGVTKANVPELYYCYRCMPNHPIHRKHAKERKVKLKARAERQTGKATPKPKSTERVERTPSRRRTLDPGDDPAKGQTEAWLKSNWDYFDKVRQHNAVLKGRGVSPNSLSRREFELPNCDASEVFQWAGLRATRGRLKEIGIEPAKHAQPPAKTKKRRQEATPREVSGNPPRPFVGQQSIPPCPSLLLSWPWCDATAPYYLGRKNYILKRMLEEEANEDKRGDAAVRSYLEPTDKERLIPLKLRTLRAYHETRQKQTYS